MSFKKAKYPISLKDRRRLIVLAFFVFCFFCLLILQFYKIQILEGDKWAQKARSQHQLFLQEPFQRGVFYANNSLKPGHPEQPFPLVIDVPKFHIYVDPDSIAPHLKHEMAIALSRILGGNEEKAEEIEAECMKKSRSRRIVKWLNIDEHHEVMDWWRKFYRQNKMPGNALYSILDYQRSYPGDSLLGQVLQTVREEKDPETDQAIPTGGLELIFNEKLQGKKGRRMLLRSPAHSLDLGKIISPSENGADVYLTINPYLQAIAEEEIAKGVRNAGAKSGWAVMMDPNTGDIWAMAQYPFFKPAEYRRYYSDPELIDHTRIKSITDCFEPGSTFKPISYAIALHANELLLAQGEAPVFRPADKVLANNGFLPGRKKPLVDLSPARYLNMYQAMQKSSNIYIASIIERVIEEFGEDWYRKQLHEVFHFGQKTGIELPSEAVGFLPTPGKVYGNGQLEWSLPTPSCLAIGYNLLVNTLQMIRAYAVIANGGYDVTPRLVKKILKTHSDGSIKTIYAQDENLTKKRLFSSAVYEEVIKAMKFTTKPGGTAYRGEIPGYTEVGKTSTSEKLIHGSYSKKDHFASFIGFTPARGSKFVLFIGIDEPEYRFLPGIGKTHYGGRCAAPVFREIAKKTLHYLGVPPDDPHGYPMGDPRYDKDKADWNLETEELSRLFKQWNS